MTQNNFYLVEITIKEEKEGKNGELTVKPLKREFIVSAINQTDLETKVTDYMKGDMRGEWEIVKTTQKPKFETYIS